MAAVPDVEYPVTVFDPATTLRKGFCTVCTKSSRDPARHKLYYEIHGDPSPESKRLVFIMGLNNSSFAWQAQVDHFGRSKGVQARHFCFFGVLVFDNRGVGSSDAPRGLYKTSEMAQDTVELLDYLEWTEEKSLNVVGVSMGGMTALELATLIPSRINSLILTSTKSGTAFDLPKLPVINMFARLSFGLFKDVSQAVDLVCSVLFPKEYLDSIDEKTGKTHREIHSENFIQRFAITKRQTVAGRIGQMGAVFKHHVSEDRLETIGKTISKVHIIHGDQDMLVDFQRGKDLHATIPGSHFKEVKGGGHALPSQISVEYNAWIESIISEP
ncbi:BQ2448_7754 [Microbotryum intermedium]|uniref:BQ2448_7754 protein n=1 Tax=Microbotryum intermedium TaxID=269621 RepID=A0A238FNG9_9BASI|nr:BQ2448_7754 [Microbotryum intermedium]